MSLSQGKFPEVEGIKSCFSHAQNTTKRLHLLGLISDGGVHSNQDHLYALLQTLKDHYNIPEVYIHFFGDGRDTDPKSAASYMEQLQQKIKDIGVGKVATVVGRYYAMDRDKRWERLEVALDGLVNGKGEEVEEDKLVEAIRNRYQHGETDEFLKPIIANKESGRIKSMFQHQPYEVQFTHIETANDTLFCFNYRSDRMREITQLLGVDPTPLPKFHFPGGLHITTMTQYKGDYPFPIAFPPQKMDDVLAEWLAKQGLKQYHIAETEKYAHVTFFLYDIPCSLLVLHFTFADACE